MIGGYGGAFGSRHSGQLTRRPRFSDGSTDAYPNKYLRPAGLLQRRVGHVGRKQVAILSLSLLFPVLLLLMLTVTVRQEDSGGTLDLQLGARLAAYSMAALSVLLALGTRKIRVDWLIFAWALVPICITLTS